MTTTAMISYKNIQDTATTNISNSDYFNYINQIVKNAPILKLQYPNIKPNTKHKLISIIENIIINHNILKIKNASDIFISFMDTFNYSIIQQIVSHLDNIQIATQDKPIEHEKKKIME